MLSQWRCSQPPAKLGTLGRCEKTKVREDKGFDLALYIHVHMARAESGEPHTPSLCSKFARSSVPGTLTRRFSTAEPGTFWETDARCKCCQARVYYFFLTSFLRTCSSPTKIPLPCVRRRRRESVGVRVRPSGSRGRDCDLHCTVPVRATLGSARRPDRDAACRSRRGRWRSGPGWWP